MFAVVYKNRVVVGPMAWNRSLFQGALERQGVQSMIPRTAPDVLPLVLTNDAKICRVEEVRPELNPMTQFYYGPLWDVSGDTAIATYEVHDTPIEFARVNFKTQAADERWKKEVSGTALEIQGQTVTINTDRETVKTYAFKYSMMADGDTIAWKFPEAWLTLTKAEFASVVQKANDHVQSAFDWEKEIADQIDQAMTAEQLVAITIKEPSPSIGPNA